MAKCSEFINYPDFEDIYIFLSSFLRSHNGFFFYIFFYFFILCQLRSVTFFCNRPCNYVMVLVFFYVDTFILDLYNILAVRATWCIYLIYFRQQKIFLIQFSQFMMCFPSSSKAFYYLYTLTIKKGMSLGTCERLYKWIIMC